MKQRTALIVATCIIFPSCDSSNAELDYLDICLTTVLNQLAPFEADQFDYAERIENPSLGSVSIYIKSEDYPERYFGGCTFYDGRLISTGLTVKDKEETTVFDEKKREELYNALVISSNKRKITIFRRTDAVWSIHRD